MTIAIIVAIFGAFSTFVGAMVYLMTLMYKIGGKVSNIDGHIERIDKTLSYLPKIFHIQEEHSNRIVRLETKLDIENRSNGRWHEHEDEER